MNKLLIIMIIKQLLEDTFAQTFIEYTYEIEKIANGYTIIVTAVFRKGETMASKYKKIRIENWVQLLTSYEEIKKQLQKSLIYNIRKASCDE